MHVVVRVKVRAKVQFPPPRQLHFQSTPPRCRKFKHKHSFLVLHIFIPLLTLLVLPAISHYSTISLGSAYTTCSALSIYLLVPRK